MQPDLVKVTISRINYVCKIRFKHIKKTLERILPLLNPSTLLSKNKHNYFGIHPYISHLQQNESNEFPMLHREFCTQRAY